MTNDIEYCLSSSLVNIKKAGMSAHDKEKESCDFMIYKCCHLDTGYLLII